MCGASERARAPIVVSMTAHTSTDVHACDERSRVMTTQKPLRDRRHEATLTDREGNRARFEVAWASVQCATAYTSQTPASGFDTRPPHLSI